MIYEGLVRYVIVTVDTNDVAKGDDADSIASRRIRLNALLDHKEVNSVTAVDGIKGCGNNKAAPKISIGLLVKTVLDNQGSQS